MQLREWRRTNKITMEQLARKLRVTRQAISAWENHRSKPRLKKAFEIARLTSGKVGLSDLYHLKRSDEQLLFSEE